MRILVAFLVLSVAEIVALDLLASYIIATDSLGGFFEKLFALVLMVVAYVVATLVFAFILCLFCGRKIYRGIGLYNFTTVISILCPVAFVIAAIVMSVSEAEYIFFNYATVFIELCAPPMLAFFMRTMTRRCDKCGLINTYKVVAVKTDSLGTEHKFHTEGGRYYNQKSTGHISTPSGRYAEVEINTTQYVPKTTVYDGLYEKKRTTTDNKCAVCGNYISDTFISSTKIGG